MIELHAWTYLLVFGVGLFAGLVDSIAGGGGIITLPVLLTLGLPPAVALGTNKLQASFGSVSAAWHYRGAGLVKFRSCGLCIVCTLVGAAIGALCVQRLDSSFLQKLIPWLLAGVVMYVIARPKVGDEEHPPRMSQHAFFVVGGLLLGFYDGFLGPGTGSFWTMLLIAVLGMNFLRATATTKVMNATSNVTSLALFLANGSVNFGAGFVMGAGQLIGARLGSRLAVTRGARFVRPIFLLMAIAVSARLLYVQLTR
ncbi:MAG TPA: TSUP family transporter [Opitutaceae bacterium]|nr:TSUP family transporter [Opitutaceae bacterium]